MANLFQPKRVIVPGLLSDDGLAAQIKELTSSQKATTAAAPPNTSAVEFADQVTTLQSGKLGKVANQQAKLSSEVRLAAQDARSTKIGSDIAGAAGALPGVKEISQLGLLSPERQAEEQDILVQGAEQRLQTAKDAQELGTAMRGGIEPPDWQTLTPDERAFYQQQAKKQLVPQLTALQDVDTAKTTPPTYEWWRNAAEVAARSAAEVGIDTLKYPVDIWDLSAETITGEQGRSEVGIWLDGVDKALTQMLPGDKARSKEFVTEISQGVGSMTGFMLGGFASRAIGLPAAVGSGVLGAAVTGNSQYEDAQNFDAGTTQKWMALVLGSALGATEAIPIDRAFFRADQATGGLVRQLLANTTASSLEEFTQELGQAVGEDLIAKFIYDENRDLDAGSWLKQAAVGAIVGAGTGATITLIEQGGQAREVEIAKVDDGALVTAAEEAINVAQQDFDAALGPEAADLPGLGGAIDGTQPDAAAPEGGSAAAATGVSADVATTEAARPPVAGDAVKQIVERAKPVKVEASAGGETAQPDGVITYKDGGTASISLRAVKRADGSFASERTITADDGTVTVEHLADGFQWRKGPAPVTVVTGFTSQTADAFSDATAAVAMARDMSPGSIAWAADGTQSAAQPMDRAQTGSVEQARGQPTTPLSARAQALDVAVTRKPSEIGRGYGDYVTYTEPSGGVLRVVERENAARAVSVVDFVVPEELRGQGIGRALMERVLADNPSLMGQVSSRAAAKLAYDMGRRPFGQPDATLEDIYNIIERDSSVNLLTPELAAVAAEAGADAAPAATEAQVAKPLAPDPDIVAQVDAVQLEPHQVSPLPDIEKGLSGPIPRVVQAAKAYAAAIGLPHRRARSYVKVDTGRAARIADAYTAMKHEPADPAVLAAYQALADETTAQYQYVKASGIKIETILEGQPDPYPNGPRDVLKDINAGHIWYFPTDQGFGSSEFDPTGNPLLEASGETSDNGQPMVVNDLFRVVHDFFGHGLEGSGFGARGEENAWQSHMRLFTASAVPAMTSETRGQNSWVNYGPFGEQNRADPRNTVYADQKTGLMPSWTWTEGVVDSTADDIDAPIEIDSMVGAPLVGAPLTVPAKPKVSDVARAFDEAHQAAYGRKLFPETSEEDFALTLSQALEDFASHVVRPGSGIGWYGADVATAIELTSLAYPTLATEPSHRDLYLTFAGIFSNGATPEQAWGMSAEAFDLYLASGKIGAQRAGGKKWGVRDAANVQQMKLVQYLIEREGSLEAAMAWLKGIQKRTDINAAMTESGLYKAGRFTTKAEQQGETFGLLAFGGKLGRYTLGLHGVELDADNTTVDLWYTRTFRRWTGRLFDAPISAEGIAGGVANERERDAVFRLTAEIQAQYPQLTAGDVQAVLWFFEKRLYAEHGVRTSEGTNSSGARKLLAARGIEGGAQRDEGGAASAEPAATTAAGRFHTAFLEAKIASPFGAAVHAYSAAELAKMRTFLAPDGLSGFALKGEDIVSVFAHPAAGGGRLRKIIDTAVANGGKTLDAFDGKLVQMYSALGFREVRRESWNDQYRPEGWKAEWGKPDVVYMEYAPAEAAEIADPDILRMTGTSTTRMPYALEPTRPQKGVASTPGVEPNDVRLTKIAENLTKLLNLTVRHGRLAGNDSNVMGQFSRRTGVIRLRTWTDLSTLAHEAGHALNDQMAAPLDAFVNSHLADINKVALLYQGDLSQADAKTRRREGFAEFFRIYAMTPDFARNRWPQFTADFEAVLDREDPQVRTGLNAIAAQVKAWQQLPSGRLIENTVIDGRREQGIGPAIKELRDLGFKTWMQELVRRNVQWSTNRYAALNRLTTDLLNEGELNRGAPIDLARADDPRVLARLARNSGSRGMVEVTDGVIGYKGIQSMSRGLREAIMVSQGIDPKTTPGALDEERLHTFSAYLVARRALEEFRRFDAGELDRPPVAFSKGDAVRAVKEWEKQFPDFIKAAEIVHEYGMALWQKSYDAGLIAKETYEENMTRQFYVPLQRDMSDKRAALGDSALTTKGSGPLRSIVKRFRGSDRDIIDPLSVLMQKTFALEQLISENDAKKALAMLSDKVGQAGALVERIPASQLIGQQIAVRDVARQLTGLDDVSDTDAADLMTILGASIKDGDTISLFSSQQASAKGEPVLFFWENGKVAAIQIKDGDIGVDVVNTLNAVGRENMDKLLEGVAATTTVFRTAITSWPDFLLVNYIRDQFSAWILNDVGYTPFVSGVKGVIDEVRQKEWAKSYNAAQGTMGGMNVAALHTAHVDRDIRSLRAKGYVANVFGDVRSGWDFPNMIKGLGRMSAVTETGTRLGLYRGAFNRAKKEGLDDYHASVEAAYTATDYIDFGLNGSKMLTTRRLVPFLNAQIQGFYKMMRTLGGDEVAQRRGLKFALGAYFKNIKNLPLSRTEKQALRTGRKAWLKMMSLGLISAALHFLFKDDEDYQEAGEYLRVTGWVIPTGDGTVAYIPKPFELAMIANAVERGLEFASGDSAAAGRFLRGVAFNLTPPTAPPAIQVAVEAANNIDFFTGRDIVPSYMQALEPELQYDHTTSSLAKWLGNTFRWSPMVVDHVLGGLGASAYRDIATMTNAADPTRPSMATTDAPILRRFVRDVRRGSVSSQDFWSQASTTNGALARAAASYKRELDVGNEPAANRRLAAMTADQRAYAVLLTHFKTDAKRLNPYYRATQITTLVSGMRRETSSALSLADTTVKDSTDTIPLTAGKKREVDTILSEIARREVRNTLIATGQPGWRDKKILPVEPTVELLMQVSPEVYDEFQRRVKKRKVYDAQTVYDYWPDVRDRLVQDGEDAVLSDAVAVASAGL